MKIKILFVLLLSVFVLRSEAQDSTKQTSAVYISPLAGIIRLIVISLPPYPYTFPFYSQILNSRNLSFSGETNALELTQEKIVGLQTLQTSGLPGSATILKWRGATSIFADENPMILLENIPFENGNFISGNLNAGKINFNGDEKTFNHADELNPFDFAVISMTNPVAINRYGLNSAGGMIDLQIKNISDFYSPHKFLVGYTTSILFDVVNKLPEMQTDYVKGTNGNISSYDSSGNFSWGAWRDTLYWDKNQPTSFNQQGQLVGTKEAFANQNAVRYMPFDNVKNFFQTGRTFENDLEIYFRKKNESRFSFTSLNQSGIIPLSSFTRYTASYNSKQYFNSKWSSNEKIYFVNTDRNFPMQGVNASATMLDLFLTPPSFDNSNGNGPFSFFMFGGQRNAGGGSGFDNPFFSAYVNQIRQNVNRAFGAAELFFNPVERIKLSWKNAIDLRSEINNHSLAYQSALNRNGEIVNQENNYRQIFSELTETGNKNFGTRYHGNLFRGTLKLSQQFIQRDYTQQFFRDSNLINTLADSLFNINSQTNKTFSFNALANLDYKSLIFLHVGSTAERSSFTNKKFFFAPTVGVAYLFSNQFKKHSANFQNGQLRFLWSKTGKEPNPLSFNSFDWHSLSSAQTFVVDGNLKPETTTTTEFGADFSLFKNKLDFHFTYYHSLSTDLILPTPISPSTGYENKIYNGAQMQNNGYEIALNIIPIQKNNFRWEIGTNFSANKNKVLSLGTPDITQLELYGNDSIGVYAIVGEPLGVLYGTRWLRDADAFVIIDDNPSHAGYGYPVMDKQNGILGNINPDFTFGISSEITVLQKIKIDFTFEINQGGNIYNGTFGAMNYYGTSKTTTNRDDLVAFAGHAGHYDSLGNVVTSGNQNNLIAPLDQYWYQHGGSSYNGAAEQFVEDASYQKLKSLSVTYTVHPHKHKSTDATRMQEIDISFVGKNLWLHTKYTGVDPEVVLANTRGIDYFNLPSTRSFGGSVKVIF